MSVRLISYSKSHLHPDWDLVDQVCYAARVSNPANQIKENEDNEKLVRYLIRNKHWSPFEMVSVCLEIKTTRDIARQILRHRSFSFQEFSQRYAKVAFEPVIREARLQDTKNRQNSIQITNFDGDRGLQLKDDWADKQRKLASIINDVYEWGLRNGIAKEQARAVLPEGLTPSTLYMSGTLRSWIHYIDLREKNGTQLEHQEIAIQCKNAISLIFPLDIIKE